jgi:hypothetical protein
MHMYTCSTKHPPSIQLAIYKEYIYRINAPYLTLPFSTFDRQPLHYPQNLNRHEPYTHPSH